jgi:hypothetical protein
MALNPGSSNGRKEDEGTKGCFETRARNQTAQSRLKKIRLYA